MKKILATIALADKQHDESNATNDCCDACAEGYSCESLAGTITASMIADASVAAYASDSAKVSERLINGKKHIVFPTVMMIAGVRQAANAPAPELLLKRVFKKALKPGLRIPLVYTHPKRGRRFVSIRAPHDHGTGTLLGYVSDIAFKGSKLVGISHLSVDRANAAGSGAIVQMNRIRKKNLVEVSIGHAARVIPVAGTFEGKAFFGIHANVELDHLAILKPGQPGACSVEDGCGSPRAAEAE